MVENISPYARQKHTNVKKHSNQTQMAFRNIFRRDRAKTLIQ